MRAAEGRGGRGAALAAGIPVSHTHASGASKPLHPPGEAATTQTHSSSTGSARPCQRREQAPPPGRRLSRRAASQPAELGHASGASEPIHRPATVQTRGSSIIGNARPLLGSCSLGIGDSPGGRQHPPRSQNCQSLISPAVHEHTPRKVARNPPSEEKEMAEPLSNGAVHQSVPESYVLPEHKRPGSSPPSSSAAAIPVVDLGSDDIDRMAEQIVAAGREFGFFQVINHGVPEDVMGAMMSAAEEFFKLPTEEKMAHYSTDSTKLPRFHTSVGKAQEQVLYWRDCLKIGCYPFEDFRHQWPEKPAGLGAALEPYTAAVRAVALRVLRLAASGLGLADEKHFEGDAGGELTAGPVVMNVNHYVACPDPSLTLGIAPHCDPNVVTVVMDNGVPGLQARPRRGGEGGGEWVDVDPPPGALVVNFGHQMEVVTNGRVRAGEHRAVTNARAPRTSVAAFVMPAMGCVVSPAPGMVAEADGEARLLRPYTYQEFVQVYTAANGDRDAVLERLRSNNDNGSLMPTD